MASENKTATTIDGPTLSELSDDINTFIEHMEKLENDSPSWDSRLLESFHKLSNLCEESPDMVPPPEMVNFVQESLSMFEEMENCGPPGSEGENNFRGRVASAIAESRSNEENHGLAIQEGTVAMTMIHSLTSPKGKKLNGNRVLVLTYHSDQERWECRAEFEKGGPNVTKALKESNLTCLRSRPLPTGLNRGYANVHDDDQLAEVPTKLCELLLNHQREGFKPSEIMFRGYAAHMIAQMGQENYMCLVCTQLEQMGGVLALGHFSVQAGEEGTEGVVFALLEGDEMYVDTLLQTMYWTAEIIESDWDSGYMGREGFGNDCPPTQLSPDQDTEPYIKTMKEGPVLLLECVAKYCFAPALWAAMSRSEYYHLFVQRLLRWTAREAKKTKDGLALGPIVRKILSSMFRDVVTTLSKPVPEKVAESILVNSSALLVNPSSVCQTITQIFLESQEDSNVMALG